MFTMKSILTAAVIGSATLAGTLSPRTANAQAYAPVYAGQGSVIQNVPVAQAYAPPVYVTPTYSTPVYMTPTYVPACPPAPVYQAPVVYAAPDCGPQIVIRDLLHLDFGRFDHHVIDEHHEFDHRGDHRR